MLIRYSNHARQRMQERKVSETQVNEVLEEPEELVVGKQEEWVATRNFGNRQIQVVYGDIDDETVLIYTVISVRRLR